MNNCHIDAAKNIVAALGLPKAQQNERTALCLLALLNLTQNKNWSDSENPLMGITPIMAWAKLHYGKDYAPNTRETFRRQSMHQFCEAGLALYNPDDPERPVNSPKSVYQIEPNLLIVLRKFGTVEWQSYLSGYLNKRHTLIARYAKERQLNLVPVLFNETQSISLSPGKHSILIKAIIEEFAPRFTPGSRLIYAGDTGAKRAYCDENFLEQLGINFDSHGKMPDVVLHYRQKNWLILAEAVTSHGPVDGKRYTELKQLFAKANIPSVYVTAFPNRVVLTRYLRELAWETEVWIADSPSHMIHLNGTKFLGPYS